LKVLKCRFAAAADTISIMDPLMKFCFFSSIPSDLIIKNTFFTKIYVAEIIIMCYNI